MKKSFLLILASGALMALASCGEQPAPSTPASEPASSSAPAAHDGKTAETAYSVDELVAVMTAWGKSETTIGTEEIFVSGEVETSEYKSNYSSYTVWLSGNPTDVELYSVGMDSSITGDYSAKNALKGMTVICKGYPELYVKQDGSKVFEIPYLKATDSPTGAAYTPTIVSVTGQPAPASSAASSTPSAVTNIEHTGLTGGKVVYDLAQIEAKEYPDDHFADNAEMQAFFVGDAALVKEGTSIVTAATMNDAVYRAQPAQGPKQPGLKLGSGKKEGQLELTFSEAVSKVTVEVFGWTEDKLADVTIGTTAKAIQAYGSAQVLEFDVANVTTVTIKTTKAKPVIFTGIKLA